MSADASQVDPRTATLDLLFRKITDINPFLDNRVNAPSPAPVDVSSIHQAAFTRLTELSREALAVRRGVGAMLWGQAGVGKSHLLARLGRWAAHQRQAFFLYLHNLQAIPERLPRSLLRAVISILTQGRQERFFQTPLFDLARVGIALAAGPASRNVPWGRLQSLYNAWVARVSAADANGPTPPDPAIYTVLYHFFRSAYRASQDKEDGSVAAACVRWLSGMALGPDEAAALDLRPVGPGEPIALADNQQIKHVFVALTRLAAAAGKPFLLVFDQIDNLDTDQVSALARFLEALIDAAPNLLVVTAGIYSTLLGWRERGVITDSAWDRLAQVPLQLHSLIPAEGVEIVHARLEAFLAPFLLAPGRPAEGGGGDLDLLRRRVREDHLFPLGQTWKERSFRDRSEVRPREVVNWAREGWQQQQDRLRQHGGLEWLAGWPGEPTPLPAAPAEPERGALEQIIDQKVDEKVTEQIAFRLREPAVLPPDADHLAGLLYFLLRQCRDAEHRYGVLEVERLPAPRRGTRPTYDLALVQRADREQPVRTGVVVVTAASATSVTGFLRRVLEDPRPLDRVLLVTDERIGLPLGERGQDYLYDLQRNGVERFRVLEVSLEQYAHLDALDQVVRQAACGDLEVETAPGRPYALSVSDVLDSYHRRGRYLSHRLLKTVLTPGEMEPATASGAPSPTPSAEE
jgi:hypothetical protein